MHRAVRSRKFWVMLVFVVVASLNAIPVWVSSSTPAPPTANLLGRFSIWMERPVDGFWGLFYLLTVIIIGALFAVWLVLRDREGQNRNQQMGFSFALAASGSVMVFVGLFFAAAFWNPNVRYMTELNGHAATAYYLLVGSVLLLAGVIMRAAQHDNSSRRDAA